MGYKQFHYLERAKRMMIQRNRIFFSLILLFSLCWQANLTAQVSEKDLEPKFRDWLKLVAYIITDQERSVFMKLSKDKDREAFIETFWKMRDPTPGTPENEFKEEMIKRFAYVNLHFKRGSSREGWQTDMGRIYMILGPPASIERLEGKTGIVPCQIWTYYGDTSKGLPSHFELIFFQKAGVGEFKLYDPLNDGPYSLLENKRELAQEDYETLYETIRKIAPTLATPAITIVPGEYGPSFYQPSPRNAIIMSKILESPKKEINPSYATNFLRYVGIVSTEYLTNYIDSDTMVEVIPDPETGLNFVHFIMAPRSLSVDFYEPKKQYFCNFILNVSLRSRDRIIFQYSREIPVYFPEDSLTRVKANGLAVEDSFPVAEGQFQLNVLLQNSVGKEFSFLEKNIVIGPRPDHPVLLGPWVGYKLEKFGRDSHLPFKLGEKKVVLDPKAVLSAADQLVILLGVDNLSDRLREKGKVIIDIHGLSPENKSARTFEINLDQAEFARMITLDKILPAGEFQPDYYEIAMKLMGENGQLIDEKKGNFVISAEKAVGHPISQVRAFPSAYHYLLYYGLALQYAELQQNELADYYYRATLASRPDYKEATINYCRFLLRAGQFDRVLEVSSGLKGDVENQFNYHLFRGQAFLGKNDFRTAVEELVQANQIYDSDLSVLNALGLAYHRLGQKDRALAAFRASLRLNPDQPEITKLLAEIEKKLP